MTGHSVRWSPRAQQDFIRIREFLESKSEKAAARATEVLYKGLATIRQLPQAGRPVQGAPSEHREFNVRFGAGGYIIRYLEGGTIFVAAIRHTLEAGF